MNDRETRRYQMFGRVQTFGQSHQSDFAPGGEAIKRFGNVGRIILELDTAKARQQGGNATAKEVLFDALRLDLQNIARTADAFDLDEPGFAAPYRLPETSGQPALLTLADAIVVRLTAQPGDAAATQTAKTALVARFVAHELPADFVQDLLDDRKAIDAAQDVVEDDDNEGVASTAAIGRLIRDGMKEVTYLDAILHNKFARQPDNLRAWQSASHIERAPQREKKKKVEAGKAKAVPDSTTPTANAA